MNIIKRLLEKHNKKKRIKFAKEQLQHYDNIIATLKNRPRDSMNNKMLNEAIFTRFLFHCSHMEELELPEK